VSAPALPALAARVLAAYGGRERWLDARSVRATVSVTGLALLIKGWLPLRHAPVVADLGFPRLRIDGLAGRDTVAWLEGGSTRLATHPGRTLAARGDARSGFHGLRRRLWWDRLDITYFLGYLLWNELTFPRLLLRSDLEWTELDGATLSARFSPALPTHCEEQIFRFDPGSGLLRRHEYTAEVFGSWARVVTVVLNHREWDGVMCACRYLTTPGLAGGQRLHWPVLWSSEVHAWRLSGTPLM
jgi:hypothetical protein